MLSSHGSPRHAPYLLHIRARGFHVGRYPPQPVSVLRPAPTLSPSFLLSQAIFEPKLFSYEYSNILKPSHSSYLSVNEDGTECSETSAYRIQATEDYPKRAYKNFSAVYVCTFCCIKLLNWFYIVSLSRSYIGIRVLSRKYPAIFNISRNGRVASV